MASDRRHHRATLTAQAADIDELGHVSNITYVRWVQDVATQHSAAVGLDLAAYQRLGGVFVVRRHEIDYLVPALVNDGIALLTHVESWKGASSVRKTRIVREVDGVELARACSTWAYVSIATGRPTRIPEDIQRAFGFA
jgi:acyl-CoA thioester hydrolase